MKKKGFNISYVTVKKLQKITQVTNQGVVAKISHIELPEIQEVAQRVLEDTITTLLFLLLDHITDARNFGTIIRTAECCGVQDIIIQDKGGEPVNSDTVKTSVGAVFNIPICKVTHIMDTFIPFKA